MRQIKRHFWLRIYILRYLFLMIYKSLWDSLVVIGIVTIIVIPNYHSCERLPRESKAQIQFNSSWVYKYQESPVISVYLLWTYMQSTVSHLWLLLGVIKFSGQRESCIWAMLRFCCGWDVFVSCLFVLTISKENFKQPEGKNVARSEIKQHKQDFLGQSKGQ